MKRYLLFIFSRFYPSGGWNDLFNSYDTIEEAKKTFEQECDITPQTEYYGEGCQIVDSTNFKIVAQFNHSAFNPELQGWIETVEGES